MTTKINKGIPYKINGPTQQSFQTTVWDSYDSGFLPKSFLVLILQGAGTLPATWPPQWLLRPFNLAPARKIAGIWEMISYKMALKIRLIWALGPAISSYSSREISRRWIERWTDRKVEKDRRMNKWIGSKIIIDGWINRKDRKMGSPTIQDFVDLAG